MTTLRRLLTATRRAVRAAWRELVDMTEWTTNPNLDRPRIGEHGDVMNPSAGWSTPNPRMGEGEARDRMGDQDR